MIAQAVVFSLPGAKDIAGDFEEPSGEVESGIVAGAVAKNPQKHLLTQVLGGFVIASRLCQEGEDTPIPALHQVLKGVAVTLAGEQDHQVAIAYRLTHELIPG